MQNATNSTPLVVPIVSDATAPQLLGMSARAFRDAVRAQRIPHVRIGARVVVMCSDLARLARVHHDRDELADDRDEREVTVDDVLAECGLRRT